MNVLIDMNLSPEWADLLRQAGHGAMHWSALGPAAAGDDELIASALATGSVILTNDLDFGITLITEGLDRPSVMQLRSDDLRPLHWVHWCSVQ
jgi:predicted nuclease of predicted toxin-antitoxin system